MKPTIIIFIAVLFQYSCGNAINPIIAPLARVTGISEIQSGLFFTLSSLMWLVASPYWGKKSQAIGRKPILLIGLGSCSVLYMAFALVGSWGLIYQIPVILLFPMLLLIRIASGIFFSTVPIAAQAYIADTTQGKERTSALTLVWMGSGLGSIIGPSLGMITKHNLMTPLYIAALLPLVGFILVWILLPSTKEHETNINKKINVGISPLDKRIWHYLLMITCLQATILSMQVTTGFFIKDYFNLSTGIAAKTIGSIFLLTGIASITSQMVFVRTLKLSSSTLLRLGTIAILLSFTSLFFHQHILAIYIAFIFLGLGIGLILPGATSGASLSVSSIEQGTVAGRIAASQGLGTLLGPMIGTSLYSLNFFLPYIAVSILFLIPTVAVWIKLSQKRM